MIKVKNHIVKNLDIGKKNLPIDQYVYARAKTLKSTQNLIAETLIADPHVIDRHLIVNCGVMLINKKNIV